jgi:hypothetical protein
MDLEWQQWIVSRFDYEDTERRRVAEQVYQERRVSAEGLFAVVLAICGVGH